MASISYMESLDLTIRKLEQQKAEEKLFIKEQLQDAIDSIKPANLVRSAIREITESTDLRDNLFNYVVGMGSGYLTKKVVVGNSHNPIKNVLGYLLQFGVSNAVSKKSDIIKATGLSLLKVLFSKKNKSAKELPSSASEKRYDEALFVGS
jgi:hypothetical protein